MTLAYIVAAVGGILAAVVGRTPGRMIRSNKENR